MAPPGVSTSANDELKNLFNIRKNLKASLTRFSTFLDKCTDSKLLQLKKRIEDFEDVFKEFNETQTRIELLDEKEAETEEREIFENKYYDILQQALEFVDKIESKNKVVPTTSQTAQNFDNTSNKFPAIELIKFYGDYDKWPQFRDLFISLIHDDPKIQKVRKFYYLMGSLRGPAEKILSGIPVTNENYDVAWNLLTDRFENEALTLKNHIKAMFEIPRISDNYSLRSLKDDFQFRYRAIEALGEPVDTWDTLLIYLVTSKLDSRTDERWEETLITKKIKKPTLDNLLEFLADRCSLTENIERESKGKSTNAQSYNKPVKFNTSNKFNKFNKHYKNEHKPQALAVTEMKCPCCNEQHYIYRCQKFKGLSVAARWEEAKRLKMCTNCLRLNHLSSECVAQGCKVCSNRHNTLLHTDAILEQNGNVACSSSTQSNQPCQILLSTALILVKGANDQWYRGKALLDSGAQSNFISERLFKKLQLSHFKVNVPVFGVGGASTNISKRINTSISSFNKAFSTELSFLVLSDITSNLPNFSFNKRALSLPNNIELADPEFNISTGIDLLIGAELFYSLLTNEQIRLGDDLPILQGSYLGWLISGPLTFLPCVSSSCNLAVNPSLEELVERFWKIEDLPQSKLYSNEEQECENHFIRTTKRDNSGRFIVNLPLNKSIGHFGSSVQNAIRRLYSVERRFVKDPQFKKKYVDFMNEYQMLGHMTKVDNIVDMSNSSFYLPHHGVLNEASTTTKLRVVFDGSCKSTNGISLNDKLLVGPNLQEDLFSILARFRQHNIVMTADIEKMYRQVLISKNERDLQRIVWRESENQPIQHYTLNTITYGTASASFLAIRCLHQAGIEHETDYPVASQIILHDFYVDDLISGASNIEEAKKLIIDLRLILNKYGFNLRKWVVNNSLILDNSTESNNVYHITDGDVKKALGVYWQSNSDTFRFLIDKNDFHLNLITKRNVLSAISKIFDPLGIVAPITIRAKLMIQSLWQLKINWDDELPHDLILFWEEFTSQLLFLNNIVIPRHVLLSQPQRIELHVFSDASLRAFGAAVYIKSYSSSQTMISLVCSKTRVAPVKTVTLPRLELCGALLGVQLHSKVLSSLTVEIYKSYFWTDSTIVLSWLKLPANTLKIFISNRVSTIQQHTNIHQWRYVPSIDNPADILSRGITPVELFESSLWWSGPTWLLSHSADWPRLEKIETEIPEIRTKKTVLVCTNGENEIFKRYSSLYRLKRIVSLCLRFINNCRLLKENRTFNNITLQEFDQATICLLKLAQADSFPSELKLVQNNRPISKKSKLLPLSPILGPDNLLRVGGRLVKSKLPFNQRHQIILGSSHSLTKLIILSEHKRQLHAGIQTILTSLRETYWILKGRLTIRSVLRKCLVCFRINPSRIIQKMATLPENRVTQNRPFYVSGVDFAGPFYIKDGKLRNRKIIKVYLCIFICFCTKAVHLEVVSDLTTNSFLNALKRFISRRGICKLLYSDNGSNLVGANNEMKIVFESLNIHILDPHVKEYFNKNNIEWKFIPPRSPHHGGLWEAAVKRAKFHIVRVVGNLHLTFEELSTVFCQVEAVLNSRPLTPISNDPDDLQALTPGHFLIGTNLTSIPQNDLSHLPSNRLNQYQLLQDIVQKFWKRWSTEYLSTLQTRSKWHESTDLLKIGSLVLLIEDEVPPLLWKMGRITHMHPSSDGLIRICTIKTSSGLFDRAIQKLCLLPIDASS